MAYPAQTKCCPVPPTGLAYAYVDSAGNFFNIYTNTFMQMLNWSGGPVSNIYEKCVLYQGSPNSFGEPEDPIDCPCCPTGYEYIYGFGCGNPFNLKVKIDSIPCIVCVCPPDDPIPVTQCEGCTENSGMPITFTFNPFIKQCQNCNREDLTTTNDAKLNAFLPYTILFPNTNQFNLNN